VQYIDNTKESINEVEMNIAIEDYIFQVLWNQIKFLEFPPQWFSQKLPGKIKWTYISEKYF